jgi:hypothetical protein
MKKFKVKLPELNAADLVKINLYRKILTEQEDVVTVIIDHEKNKYLVIRNGMVGYIQKFKTRLFVKYKDKTEHNVDKYVHFEKLLDKYNIFPDNVTFNINGLSKMIKDAGSKESKLAI